MIAHGMILALQGPTLVGADITVCHHIASRADPAAALDPAQIDDKGAGASVRIVEIEGYVSLQFAEVGDIRPRVSLHLGRHLLGMGGARKQGNGDGAGCGDRGAAYQKLAARHHALAVLGCRPVFFLVFVLSAHNNHILLVYFAACAIFSSSRLNKGAYFGSAGFSTVISLPENASRKATRST